MQIALMINELTVTGAVAWAWIFSQSQSLAANAGSALVTSIWQSAVIVCALEIALRLAPRISAAYRFALWAAGFVIAVALPFLPHIRFGADAQQAVGSDSPLTPAASHAFLHLDARWGLAIAALWLVASLIRAAALAVHSIRLRRLWKTAQPVPSSASHSTALNHLRQGRIAICTTQLLDRPSVIGFLSPRILIPAWLLSRLTPGELDQIVLHEAEHLRRADDWTNLIQKLCLVLFPLNPALAWIEHRLCREREMACDEGVIRITNAPRAYAACLASLAERRLERRAEALSLGAWHRRSELVHRVHRILLHRSTMSRTAAGALLATLGSMLLAASVEMSRFPELIAFVPKHNIQAITPARQVQLDELLSRESAEAKPQVPTDFNALPAKAILPDRPSSVSAHARRHSGPRPAPETRSSSHAAPTSTQQIASTDLLGDRVISPEPQPQQWVVVTTWREVSSVSRVPQTISDFEPESEPAKPSTATSTSQSTTTSTITAGNTPSATPANTNARSSNASNQPSTPAHHFTVTQLILRVVPANPNPGSAQPPTATVRDGWFVIQL